MAAAAPATTTRRPPPPHGPENPLCPRCESQDTKFCYYNNYNLAQPRYFCRSCRRYWTLGGSLRNIPVGGTTRKSSTATTAYATKRRRTRPSHAAPSSVPSSPSTLHPPTIGLEEPTKEDDDPNMAADVAGTFGQLLMEPLPPFREPFGRVGFGLGLGLGLGLNGIDEMGCGLGRSGWSFLGGDDAGLVLGSDGWQIPGSGGDGTAGGGGSCMGWPDLTISSRRVE